MSNVKVNEVYRHFKGNTYRVIAIAKDCDDLKELVVYQNIDKGDVWVRPLDNFTQSITRDGKTFERFKKIK